MMEKFKGFGRKVGVGLMAATALAGSAEAKAKTQEQKIEEIKQKADLELAKKEAELKLAKINAELEAIKHPAVKLDPLENLGVNKAKVTGTKLEQEEDIIVDGKIVGHRKIVKSSKDMMHHDEKMGNSSERVLVGPDGVVYGANGIVNNTGPMLDERGFMPVRGNTNTNPRK